VPRRSRPDPDPETLRASLVDLLTNFATELKAADLRRKVRALVPAYHKLRDLGSSLVPKSQAPAARDRIIYYLRKHPKTVVAGDELMVVSGIGEWARRVRELRVQFGWWIYSGVTFRQMAEEDEDIEGLKSIGIDGNKIKPDEYVLMRTDQDRDAAHRWNLLNEVRRMNLSVQDKLIEYFRRNVTAEISGEELKYLAKDKKEWARRVRELRTEKGWPIVTKNSGRPDLDVGVYVLEEDRQAYEHDRRIPDAVRVEVLERDKHRCVKCGWGRDAPRTPDDPRNMLELHHVKQHKDRGENSSENLITLCNVHHDEEHAKTKK
jgi:hypothetical protein